MTINKLQGEEQNKKILFWCWLHDEHNIWRKENTLCSSDGYLQIHQETGEHPEGKLKRDLGTKLRGTWNYQKGFPWKQMLRGAEVAKGPEITVPLQGSELIKQKWEKNPPVLHQEQNSDQWVRLQGFDFSSLTRKSCPVWHFHCLQCYRCFFGKEGVHEVLSKSQILSLWTKSHLMMTRIEFKVN